MTKWRGHTVPIEDEKCIQNLGNKMWREETTQKDDSVDGCKLDSSGSGWGPLVCFCTHGNTPSGSIKDREFV